MAPLNKYIAQAGVTSRRKAVALIASGSVQVNGTVVKTPGHRVTAQDLVCINGLPLNVERHTYILLNKPKDFISTTLDEKGRKKVTDLIPQHKARLFCVGRLDRTTTGLLLLTNDGLAAQQLAHPRYNVQKVYRVTVDRRITQNMCDQLRDGILLEDGLVQVDHVVQESSKTIVITLHSGKNRVVRRLCEFLGLGITALDRIQYGSLTKQNLRCGMWRYLTDQEIAHIKSSSPRTTRPGSQEDGGHTL
jgi:23S rRNA pseudouridine2605 synthase